MASELGLTRQAVFHWIKYREYPKPEHARRIVELSGGSVTLNDIYVEHCKGAIDADQH